MGMVSCVGVATKRIHHDWPALHTAARSYFTERSVHYLYISSIEINNYKSYLSPGILELKPGFNVITSQNNTGKTALLEALQLFFSEVPHRSLNNVDSNGNVKRRNSSVDIVINMPREEMLLWLHTHQPIYVPHYDAASIEAIFYRQGRATDKDLLQRFNDWVLEQDVYTIHASMPATKQLVTPVFSTNHFIIKKDWYEFYDKNTVQSVRVQICPDYKADAAHVIPNSTELNKKISDIGNSILIRLKSSLFSFRAERYNHGECAVGSSTVLAPDTANLAEVLDQLQSNSIKMERYINKVRQILPSIYDVSVRKVDIPNKGIQSQIIIWNDDSGLDELAVPLTDCGTGVGQVLAMLYVVMNARTPQTIIIDEPNSFLHPGAVRKLIDVLQEYPQHQYILTTHSSTVITASKPSTLTMIKKQGAESYFQVIDPNENDQARIYLSELGAMADVFGADNILWVEGETEQECFPYIVKQLLNRPILGTVISKVLHTGDFDKDPMIAFQVYTRMSKFISLIPPTIGFVFDREERLPSQINKWEKDSKGLVKFLPRRLYENYLLNADALASVINECDTNRPSVLTSEAVQKWIDNEVDAWISEAEQLGQRGKKDKSQPPMTEKKNQYGKAPSNIEHWKKDIHGAHLLERLFEHYCGPRLPYKKTDHSKRLTLWLIKHNPQELEDIIQLLREAFSSPNADLPS